jgi:nucleotide-binding universal stress UspA family protein
MKELEMILCGVDFSPASECALELAADLARRHRCQLTVAHVQEPPTAVAADMLVSPPELFDEAVRQSERELERCRVRAQELSDRPARSAMLMGPPADALVAWAREHPCDVVVVATHGRGGLKRLVLGSVAEKVARHAPCSVVVARPASRD